MIVRHNLKWSVILKGTWRSVLFFIVAALVAAAVDWRFDFSKDPVPPAAISALGAALAIFLAFRNSAAYDRWWEARKQWGTLINASRSFARQLTSLTRADGLTQQQMIYRQVAFAHALRLSLRAQGSELKGALEPLLNEDELRRTLASSNAAMWLMQQQGQSLRALGLDGKVDPIAQARIDETLSVFTDVQGACERIKNTPLPRQYEYFPRVFVYVYATLLPLSLNSHLGFFTPLVTVPISFLFLALESVGRITESPFENRIQDVPLTALCRTIERNLRDVLGETNLPPPVEPVDGFLW